MEAKVFFTDLRSKAGNGLLEKMAKLTNKMGLKNLIEPGDLTAVKLHFGEPGNLAYIRPPYVRRMIKMIKDLGGKPFLTDANTLYVGGRSNSVDHLESAIMNGFDYSVCGAPLIIADGLTGKDYVKVPVEGRHFKEVNIGSAAVHADAIICMTHFKCHELSGIGGAIKNLGMGLGSRSGKQQMHSDVLPVINEANCTGCAKCTRWCPAEAMEMEPWNGNKKGQKAHILDKKCWGCGECAVTCTFSAITPNWRTTPAAMQEKMSEYALGVMQGKQEKVGFVNFLMDISPECDCYSHNDAPIVADIGILASLDPVALDQACTDLVNSRPVLPGCMIADLPAGHDKFKAVHPKIDWEPGLAHAEAIGLGTRKYKIIEV